MQKPAEHPPHPLPFAPAPAHMASHLQSLVRRDCVFTVWLPLPFTLCGRLFRRNCVVASLVETESHLTAPLRRLCLFGRLHCRHYDVTASSSLRRHFVTASPVASDLATAFIPSPASAPAPLPSTLPSLLNGLCLCRRICFRLCSRAMRRHCVLTVYSLLKLPLRHPCSLCFSPVLSPL